MKKKNYILLTTFAILSFATSLLGHVDNYLLTEECGSCHIGHGIKDEPMLSHGQEQLCYQCHGSPSNQSSMKSAGLLSSSVDLADLEEEFKKPYRHPVKKGFGHSPTEKLDGYSLSAISHSECVDCHNPHTRIEQSKDMKHEVPGISLSGQYRDESSYEYEVCFKCHASMSTIDNNKKNMRQSFALSNKSQHPVTTDIRSNKSISMKNMSLSFESSMKCSHCHTNDNPDGPQGPHGSKYKFLLSGNYNTDASGNESSFAYQFCYSCHDRSSILSNESFSLHKEHIVGDLSKNIKGTSCFTCHASHSSSNNEFLIEFNPEAVSPDNNTRQLQYISNGNGSGECYLNCHGLDHSPARYSK